MAVPLPAAAPVPKIRPSMGWVALAIVLLLAGPGGCSAFAVTHVVGVVSGADDFGRFEIPVDSATVGFSRVVSDGAIQLAWPVGQTEPQITDLRLVASDGTPVPIVALESSTTIDYTSGGTGEQLREIGRFTIDQPGTYLLTVTSGSFGQVWLGHRIDATKVTAGLGPAVLGGTLVFLAGLTLLIVVLVRRGRARRALRPAMAWGGPGYGMAPPGPPGYGMAPPGPPGYGLAPPGSPPPSPPPAAPGWGAPPAPPAPPGPDRPPEWAPPGGP